MHDTNSESVTGDWRQLRAAAQETWAKLTDEDLDFIDGKFERLLDRIQHHYGLPHDEAELEILDWLEMTRRHG